MQHIIRSYMRTLSSEGTLARFRATTCCRTCRGEGRHLLLSCRLHATVEDRTQRLIKRACNVSWGSGWLIVHGRRAHDSVLMSEAGLDTPQVRCCLHYCVRDLIKRINKISCSATAHLSSACCGVLLPLVAPTHVGHRLHSMHKSHIGDCSKQVCA
jgi:tRNA A37 threonylcarbamoyladenosine synthetase subunit TsaC/SUA5/YrdC